jgi:hypothetical protein
MLPAQSCSQQHDALRESVEVCTSDGVTLVKVRAVKQQPVNGWSSRVSRQDNGGWQITWTNLGAPIPFGTPIFFPIRAAWPTKPGIYGMSVLQLCPNSSYYWNDEYAPANGSVSSPPLTPRPEVLVVAPSTPATKKAAQSSSSTVHHH